MRKQYRRRLRSRIIFSFLLFSITLTVLFSITSLWMRERFEANIIGETLQREVDVAVKQTRQDPEGAEFLQYQRIRGWMIPKQKFSEVPFAWRHMNTGVYDISDTENGELRRYKLAVRKDKDYWGFLRYDVTDNWRTRNALIIAIVLITIAFILLSVWMAFWLSRRVLKPVTELVARIQRSDQQEQIHLAKFFADDEVGQLAAALDDHAQRLTALVERDKAFNADVSHELRTPLAVIRGATELLLAQEDLPEKTQERIRRVDRAARQCVEMTEALLVLARGEKQLTKNNESCDVGQVVEQVVEAHRLQLNNKPVTVRIENHASKKLPVPASVLAVALGNLIANAFKYTAHGEVAIFIETDEVRVEDTGLGVNPQEVNQLFDRGYRSQEATGKGAGLGLAIVRRLCDLYGWKVSLSMRSDQQGTCARLIF